MIRNSLLGLLALPALAACGATGEVRSPASLPAAQGNFVEGNAPNIAPTALPPQWWRLFDDAELDAHVERALAANADLRVALANLEVARATARQAAASRLPATVLESGAGPDRADRQPSTSSVPKTSYELGATVAYEIDLFGRLSGGARAARADLAASAALMDAARIAVAGDTVAAYIDYCGAVQTRGLTRTLVEAHERSLALVQQQLQQGEVSPLEVAQAQTALQRARAGLPALEADRRRALFRLATLEGLPPVAADGWRLSCNAIPALKAPLPIGDGAALLARRPDIREAEQRVIAATARIDIARADLYPRISLGGSAGLIAGGFDAILTPLISWSFPNRSIARAKIAAAQGTEAAALASWDAAILRALREVESALADYRAERSRRAELASALGESEKAARRAQARFRLGADSYLLVLDAERTRTDIATLGAASDLRLAQIEIALFRALGGGWEQPSGQTP
jgi:NodT family efflux transporter outer membrane factor (OMF) lipoprotein